MKKLLLTALMMLLAFTAMAKQQVVYVYNWSEYIPDSVLQGFEEETGIKVIYSTYDSNEVMYAKVKVLQGKGYDVVFPSSYYVNKMKREGMLLPLDQIKLPNLKYMDKGLLDKPYDEGNKYSLPYLWGSTSIVVNTNYVDINKAKSWDIFWDPAYKGKILLNDDLREVFHVALTRLGYSGNSTNEKEITAAYELLKSMIPSVRVFNSDSPKIPFLNEEVVLGLTFNGEAFAAAEENPAIKYVYPKEGAIFWVDNLCILKGSENPDNAHKFINYIMKPEVAKIISDEFGYASPNKAAKALQDEETRNNPTIYPPQEVVDKGEFQLDVGETINLYEKYWEMLKTGH
jgi:spermidine/putrescine transport system substrate-binding protein